MPTASPTPPASDADAAAAAVVVIGGGTGLVGSRLADMLAARGDEVRLLSRSPERVRDHAAFAWDTDRDYLDPAALAGATHVVNLAGAGIADARWTDARKRLIVESRTGTTALLGRALAAQADRTVRAYVSASAIGYYGDRGDAWVREDSEPGTGFLSESTVAWEDSVRALAEATGLRTCLLRTGIALSPEGGALEKMLVPARLGVSGYFGDGAQYYSWIHLDDLCRAYLAALDDEAYVGPVNAVAPTPVTCKTLARVLAEALPNPAVALPVPAFGLRLALGEMSHTVLDSTRVSSTRLVDALGFDFEWPSIEGALRDLV